MWKVLEAKKVLKELDAAPKEMQKQYQLWKEIVETSGPQSLLNLSGYRDHALKGEWKGARSSYLNIRWRVLYLIQSDHVQVLVLRIAPHDYRR